jgi:cold-inducible RNA-binding protein
MFAPFGAVSSIRLAVHPETGVFRGFGLVRMADEQGSRNAIVALNGKDVSGRPVRVKEARMRAGRQPRNGSQRP